MRRGEIWVSPPKYGYILYSGVACIWPEAVKSLDRGIMFELDSETAEVLATAPISVAPFDPAGFPDFFVMSALQDPASLLDQRADSLWEDERRDKLAATKIRTAINASPDINALALQNGALRVVSLNLGMCIRVRQMMWQATHNTEVFRPRPNEQALRPELLAESSSKFSPAWLTQPVNIRPGLDDDAYHRILIPVAPSIERVQLAIALNRCALNFIILHEMAHIVRNQSAFLPGSRSAFFTEIRDNLPAQANEEQIRLECLLEVDADIAAVDVAFSNANRSDDLWAGWTDSPIERAGLSIISIALVFWLFQACNISLMGADPLHPSPLTRIMMLASYLGDIIPGFGLLDADDVVPFTLGAIASAAKVWDDFGLSGRPSFSNDGALEAMSEVEEITRALRHLGIRG